MAREGGASEPDPTAVDAMTPGSMQSTDGPAQTALSTGDDAAVDEGIAASGSDAADASADDSADAPTDDALPDADDAGQPSQAAAVSPSVGDLVITEIMFDPSGPLPEAEWFEVGNLTASPLLLSGLMIQDGAATTHTIVSSPQVIVPALGYAVLVRNEPAALASQVPPSSIVYEYGAGLPSDQGIELASDATGDVSLWSGSTLLVDVPYGPWGVASVGQSIELAALQIQGADQAPGWCLAQFPWTNGSDDGTPGDPSDCP